ncbi:gluconeogenesis factor YvcK family protein [Quadrisphaera sp. KR29]|uniref:gluconeogenesis factor YvcK family protein n=1 Tax=Quadrisphaera sp. KR29 TaxID=3461391 RepID=UPI004043F659
MRPGAVPGGGLAGGPGPGTGPAVVACGGGHGLAASLQALRHLSDRITAVVTVADDGGSSGRLRAELGTLPPGDLRMALAALCDDTEWGRTWRDVLQHRFTGDGPLAGHAVGNLLIAALWQRLGDTVEGLDLVGRLLGARGRVLPMSSVPLSIEADVRVRATRSAPGRLEVVRGQKAVATTRGTVEEVRLVPVDPPARPEVVQAVRAADWVVLGPGSWFTSVMPHLLVPDLAAALRETRARRCLVLNLVSERGETSGLSPAAHVRALTAHARGLRFDVVLADPSAVEDVEELAAAAEDAGARLVLRQVRRGRTAEHDPLRLAAAMRDVLEGSWGDVA